MRGPVYLGVLRMNQLYKAVFTATQVFFDRLYQGFKCFVAKTAKTAKINNFIHFMDTFLPSTGIRNDEVKKTVNVWFSLINVCARVQNVLTFLGHIFAFFVDPGY